MKWLRFPRVLGLLVCVYLVGMSVVFGVLSNRNYRFVHDAASTQGTVVELVARAPVGSTREPRDDGRVISLAPKVSYTVGDQTYTYVAAHGRYHQPLQVGQQVTVLYDPEEPQNARLKGEGRVLVPLITSGFVAAAVLVAVILFRTRDLGEKPRRRRRQAEDDASDPVEPERV